MKFKVGDTVRCIQLILNHSSVAKVGKIQKIVRVDETDETYNYKTDIGIWFNEKELELVDRIFKKSDLMPGYIVERMDGSIRMVVQAKSGLYLTDGGTYLTLEEYNDDLESKTCDHTIKRVYDFVDNPRCALDLIVFDRELIWERPENAKEITMSDIEEKFGCKVKIVKEEN